MATFCLRAKPLQRLPVFATDHRYFAFTSTYLWSKTLRKWRILQKSKFCSVGAISKIFERDFSMFYGVVSIIVCASVTTLVLNQYKFGFEAQFFVLSMGAVAAISHNFILASSGAGITPFAPYAVAIGFIYAIYVGFFTKKA